MNDDYNFQIGQQEQNLDQLTEKGRKLLQCIEKFSSHKNIGNAIVYLMGHSLVSIVFKIYFTLSLTNYSSSGNVYLLLFAVASVGTGILNLIKLDDILRSGQHYSEAMKATKEAIQNKILTISGKLDSRFASVKRNCF